MTLLNVPGATLVPAPVAADDKGRSPRLAVDMPTGLRLLTLGFWATS